MSPEVWVDARRRIAAAARANSVNVAWPNEPLVNGSVTTPTPWIDIEAAAESSSEIEIGGIAWDERGSVYIHVMIPVGTGVIDGFKLRMAMSNAFLDQAANPVGLSYRNGRSFDLLGPPGDDGVYRRLTVAVRYHYQTILTMT